MQKIQNTQRNLQRPATVDCIASVNYLQPSSQLSLGGIATKENNLQSSNPFLFNIALINTTSFMTFITMFISIIALGICICFFENNVTKYLIPLLLLSSILSIFVLVKPFIAKRFEKPSTTSAVSTENDSSIVFTTTQEKYISQPYNQEFANTKHQEKSNNTLLTMLTNVSHEVRTPLTSLMMTCECVADGVYDPTPDVMNSISEQAQNINKTFSTIKDFSRFISSPLCNDDVDAQAIMNNVYERFKALDHLQDVSFDASFSLSEGQQIVSGSVQEVERVFTELANNALTHAKGANKITFTSKTITDDNGRVMASYCISDNGIGTDAESSHLTMPFWKEDESHTSSVNPTNGEVSLGLGLAYAKEVATRLNGDLSILSSRENGMSVSLLIPLQ